MESKFVGFWSGIVQGSYKGNILVCIKGFKNHLNGHAILYSDEGHRDLVTFRGEEKEANIADFSLIKYMSTGSNVINPSEGKVKLMIQNDAFEINGEWSTDIGTVGKLTLWKAKHWEEKILLIPSPIYGLNIKVIRKFTFPNLCLLFLLLLVLLSLCGWITKLSAIEGIILLIPIVYLFRSEVRKVLWELGVKKLGSFEFYQQTIPPNYQQVMALIFQLRNTFGEETFTYFVYLNRFLVPKTRMLLKRIAVLMEPVTLEEFARLAKSLDIQDDNIHATLQALLGSHCISIDNESGKISITEYGQDFLRFEAAISNFINI